MNSKALALQSRRDLPENRAKCWQISGRSTQARIGRQHQTASWARPLISRFHPVLIFFLSLPAALGAQTQQGSWSGLNGLKSGQGIEVIETSMKRHAGSFVSVDDGSLTLKESGSDVTVKRGNVVRVSTSSGPKRLKHALIGLAIGGGIGAGIGAASGSAHGFFGGSSRGITALFGIAIGAPSGAVVGAVVPAHTTIYRADPAAPSH